MIVPVFNCHLPIMQLSLSCPETQYMLLILLKYMTYFQRSSYLCCSRPGCRQYWDPGLGIVNIRV